DPPAPSRQHSASVAPPGGYSSLGAIVSALIAPFYVWWFKPQYTFPVSMLSCLILLRHHDNIQRLWRRQEATLPWALSSAR
uniref:glycerol-3-phosphate acyltransferase n=1 Tax=Escherichia coli TaxID=562 RepID=UPI001597108E